MFYIFNQYVIIINQDCRYFYCWFPANLERLSEQSHQLVGGQCQQAKHQVQLYFVVAKHPDFICKPHPSNRNSGSPGLPSLKPVESPPDCRALKHC
jgi:hypothetical protein